MTDPCVIACAMCRRLRVPPDEEYDLWANIYLPLPEDEVQERHAAWLCIDCAGVLRAGGILHTFRDAVLREQPEAVFIWNWRVWDTGQGTWEIGTWYLTCTIRDDD